MNNQKFSPQRGGAYKGRQPVIDAIRGFSLLGILLSNMPLFMYGLDATTTSEIYPFNQTMFNVLEVLIIGSFYPIFLFLFGYGTQQLVYKLTTAKDIPQSSLIQQGWIANDRPKATLRRRFLMLSLLGVLHFILVWDGDILLSYGVLGFVLLLFINQKTKTLITWTIVLGVLMLSIYTGYTGSTPESLAESQNYYEQAQMSLGNGIYLEVIEFRLLGSLMEGIPGYAFLILAPVTFLIYLPIALLGMIAARHGWFINPESKRRTYIKYAAILGIIGFVLNLAGVLMKESGISFGYSLIMNGGPFLAFGYIFLFAYLYTRTSETGKMKQAFTAVGKLSLTNYLLHSMICTFIFYGYGIGLFGQLGLVAGTLLALAIYMLTAALSYLYLQRFHSGPVEWLLRKITYRSPKSSSKRNVSG
ncbi:DUF418 domain-containing protein [Paenibacillus sp. 453mf]|uniref:DUF418 domain-containing protein n=1 Tax=Paenibacillus sp. 453mf TaxID=1761874 RepID=UPI0008F1A789|nr:DUF418 domain-containing protein [Paenibacillus sp. 453mf]SFS86923.1 uncharacterized protein SAMN04488601_105209 [Paenibacillus sp. 453mf]